MKSIVAIPIRPYGKAKGLSLLALIGHLAGCSAGLKVYPTDVPPNSLRLGEVSSLASTKDIKVKKEGVRSKVLPIVKTRISPN
jgi:hypothetical protein